MGYKVVIHRYVESNAGSAAHNLKDIYAENVEHLEGGALRVVFTTDGGGDEITYGPSAWYSVYESSS